jgi:hypothetical protein
MMAQIGKMTGKTKLGRRSFRDSFLTALRKLSGEEQKLVNNRTLMDELGWEEDRYDRVRSQLKDENQILFARGGPGGAVALVGGGEDETAPPKLFISYCHADEALKEDLLKHLTPLKRLNLISEWHDRKIVAGDKWGDEISKNLEEASIILLLVSIDFINSQYCYAIEMDKALERGAEKGCVVIPIILRGCMWQHTPFATLQALPTDSKAVTSWPDRDQAFVNIAEGVKKAAEKLMAAT